jgi:exodeoxyribonuclease VII large subunit
MWRQRNQLVKFRPKDGMAVMVRARVGLYEPRGEYQLLIEHLEEAGEGALKREFEKLKARLAAEGLFAAERKRPLPAVPRRIGVVSSPTGAAIHDIRRVLRARFPGTHHSAAAAFLLGRTYENAEQAQAARRFYELYERESPSGEFAAEALAGRMRIVASQDGVSAGRALAEQYLARYPHGVHAKTARQLLH